MVALPSNRSIINLENRHWYSAALMASVPSVLAEAGRAWAALVSFQHFAQNS